MSEEKKEDTRLSYSSMSQLQTCEAQYAHRKIYKTPEDNPDEDRTAFDVGSATHHCVEHTDWGLKKLTRELVDEAIELYPDAADHKGLVHGMALALIKQQELSGLICVKAEQVLDSPKFVGYIDLIAKYPNGDWYIIDLKTSSMKPNDGKVAMLPLDRQLNLYASYAEKMGPLLELSPDQFKGVIYRVVVKSKAKQKPTETYQTYVKRMVKASKVYDVIIPKEKLNIPVVVEMFEEAYERSMQLRAGEVPRKNLGACFNYFKLCPYYSNCYGDKSEEMVKKVQVKTSQDYELDALDMEDL